MIKKIILPCIAAGLFSMCSSPTPSAKSTDFVNLKKAVEDSTDNFDPGYFKYKHVALVYKIDNGVILDSLDSTSLKHKVGKMPRMRSGGSFHVIYYLDKGHGIKDTVSYFMHSPLFHRIESGSNPGAKRVRTGSFEVPLPLDRRIETVILLDKKEILATSDVRRIFRGL